jgi:4-amino-4-deoxy-L-arabinose transferase-like glycosyltransferase
MNQDPTPTGPGDSKRHRVTRSSWALVVVAAIVAVFTFQGSRGLWDPDEGRYVQVAAEMLKLGNFLVPHSHAELPHLSKPPLTYWLVASSLRAFGWNEWAARLPNAVAMAFTILLLSAIGRRLVPTDPWLPAAVYGTSLLPFVASNIVTTDTVLTLWEVLAMSCFVEAWWGAGGSRRRILIDVMWLGWGLAFLTKGPAGLLPLAAVLGTVVWTEGAKGLRLVSSIEGIALFATVGLGWYALLVVRSPDILSYFVGYEVVGRFASDVHNRHPEWWGPVEVYLPVLLAGFLPWLPLGLPAARRAPEKIRHLRLWTRAFWKELEVRAPGTLLLFLWIAAPLLVFSIERSRLPLYVLPLSAPIAVLLARRLRNRPAVSRRRWLRFAWIWLVLLVSLKAGAARITSDRDARALAQYVRDRAGLVDEIVFVETAPRLGLGFYLHNEVELVLLGDPETHPWRYRATSSMAAELAGPFENRLWVVDVDMVSPFEEKLQNLKLDFKKLGTRNDLVFYVLLDKTGTADHTLHGGADSRQSAVRATSGEVESLGDP